MQKHGLFYTRSTLTATIISLSLAACRSRDKAPLWITSPKAWQRSDLTTSQRTPSSSTPSPRLLWVLFKPWGQDVQTAAGKWSESEMIAKCVDTCTPWSCAKWFPCLDLKNSDSLYIYISIYYIVQSYHLQSLSRGGIGIARLSHWTITKHIFPYAPVQSDVCQRKSRHIWIMALVEAVTKQWCGKA